MKFTNLEPICKMLGISEEAFIKKAVLEAISPYLDEDGFFTPRPAFILPSEYELKVAEVEANIEGRKAKDIPTRKCVVLSETTMMEKPYMKVFCDGNFLKVPKEKVVLREDEEPLNYAWN